MSERRAILEERSWILNADSFGHFILDDPSSSPPFHSERKVGDKRGGENVVPRRDEVPSHRNKREKMRDKACMQIGGPARISVSILFRDQ